MPGKPDAAEENRRLLAGLSRYRTPRLILTPPINELRATVKVIFQDHLLLVPASDSENMLPIDHSAAFRGEHEVLRHALRHHWHPYLFEGYELSIFMLSACAFTIFIFDSSSGAVWLIPSAIDRRAFERKRSARMTFTSRVLNPVIGIHWDRYNRSGAFTFKEMIKGDRPPLTPALVIEGLKHQDSRNVQTLEV